MRHPLMAPGSGELVYEIRAIVKKAEALQALGKKIIWENIGDPVHKNAPVPPWMKQIVTDLAAQDTSYKYCHSKGVPATRAFLAHQTNERGGIQITADDILFFNGLGDAITKVYQYLTPTARVIGPSPAYSTHSSAEAAHAHHHPLTYPLDPARSWKPDLENLYLQVKHNPHITGILLINPNNPTGAVHSLADMQQIVAIAREFGLFVVCDEVYINIVNESKKAYSLAEVIGDVPGIALKGISKEFPWPGARCGWAEFYNRHTDEEFNRYCTAIENAKMLEVCATTLPQLAIPVVMQHPAFKDYRANENKKIAVRSRQVAGWLADIPAVYFNSTEGAFFNTIVFKEEYLQKVKTPDIKDQNISRLYQSWTADKNMSVDKKFVYYLLCTKGVCVVPISSFHTNLQGFRVTLLEEDPTTFEHTFILIKEAIAEFFEA